MHTPNLINLLKKITIKFKTKRKTQVFLSIEIKSEATLESKIYSETKVRVSFSKSNWWVSAMLVMGGGGRTGLGKGV